MSHQPDSELSATARQVIADARDFGEPTAEDRERVRTRWLATIAVGAGLTSLSGAARAATATSWGLKSAGLALAFVAGVGGLYVMYGRTELDSRKELNSLGEQGGTPSTKAVSPQDLASNEGAASTLAQSVTSPGRTVPPEPRMPVLTEPATVPATSSSPVATDGRIDPSVAPTPPSTSEAGGAPAPAVPVVREAARVVRPVARSGAVAVNSATASRREVAPEAIVAAGASAPTGHLGEEIALLSRIRSSVQDGANAQALVLLDEYGRTFEHPALGMEAQALRVDALCRSGQRDAARLQATAFEASWPESPLLERVRTACP